MARPDKWDKKWENNAINYSIQFFLSGYHQILGKKAPNYSDKNVLNVNFTDQHFYQKL